MYDAVLMTCVTATTIECRKTNCPREYSKGTLRNKTQSKSNITFTIHYENTPIQIY